MTERINHKVGDTFTAACEAWLDEAGASPRDLTNVSIKCVLRSAMKDPITIHGIVVDAVNGQYELRASAVQTAKWTPGLYLADIQYTESGVVDSTETFQIDAVRDIT